MIGREVAKFVVGISIGLALGAGGVSASSSEASQLAVSDPVCEADLTEALAGWDSCEDSRAAMKLELALCREGGGRLSHHPVLGSPGGLTLEHVPKLVSELSPKLTLEDVSRIDETVVGELARRAATAKPAALEELRASAESFQARAATVVSVIETIEKAGEVQ